MAWWSSIGPGLTRGVVVTQPGERLPADIPAGREAPPVHEFVFEFEKTTDRTVVPAVPYGTCRLVCGVSPR